MSEKQYNPWRTFIKNCQWGDNYFRSAEYDELLAYMDADANRIAELERQNVELRQQLAASADKTAATVQPVAATWTDWPDGSGFMGYYWTKAGESAAPELVHISNAKEGHALQGWKCPGIERYYFDYTTSRTFAGLAAPQPQAASEDSRDADGNEERMISAFAEWHEQNAVGANGLARRIFNDGWKAALAQAGTEPK
jgi:hypothetical protein